MRQDNYERLQERSRREFGDRQKFGGSNSGDYERSQNFSGARPDYNDRANDDRGFIEKASDEVSSWFGGGNDRDEHRNNEQRSARERNVNEYDGNSYHSYQAGYTPKEANPFYPTTNRIYERGNRKQNDEHNDYPNRNFQSEQTDYNRNQSRGFASMRNENRDLGNQNIQNRNFRNQTGQNLDFRNQNDQFSNQNQQQNRWRDWHDTRAGDLMTRNVSTVHPNDSVQHAARLMRDEDCGALPVVDRNGTMIGMITDRDITVRLVADGDDPRRAPVEDCMTDEVFACHVNDQVEHCIRAMKEHQVRRMPIVNDRNQLLGIISQGDLARYADMNKRQGQRHAFTDLVSEISEPSNNAYR